MTFIHPYLLLGLSLAALPVVLHLLMRQKPKQLQFPAFRFLRQKAFTNRRKLRLQHLLLLLLRMLLIALLCLGLARPRVASEQVGLGTDKAIAAVLVFDTSLSMEYTVANVTRLDEAKQRARELLDEMSGESELVVLDSGEDGGGDPSAGQWLQPAAARSRVEGLRLRPANGPLTRPVERAFRLLREAGNAEEAKPRFLFVFADRTRESWDAAEAKRLQKPEGVTVVFVDVGIDNPADLALDKVEIDPPVAAPGGTVQVKVTARATGADYDTKLACHFGEDDAARRAPDERAVALAKGQSKVLTIDRTAPGLPAGVTEQPVQVVVKLATNDALPFDNTRFATFLVREPRRVLTVADDPREAHVWKLAFRVLNHFRCDVMTPADAARLDARGWGRYKVACLFETAQPPAALWSRLRKFVEAGGGLCLVPGGKDVLPAVKEYNREGSAQGLLPARWEQVVTVPAGQMGVGWAPFATEHPITAAFYQESRRGEFDFTAPATRPRANAFWVVKPVDGQSVVITTYAGPEKRPALVERPVGQGRVVQFTTTLDGKELAKNRPWHNYWGESAFGIMLVDLVCKYLAGEAAPPELNYIAGVAPLLGQPAPPAEPPFTLDGPDLADAERNLTFADTGARLAIRQAVTPGNYLLKDGKGRPAAGFSVNVRAEESQLERVPAEEFEAVLGKDAVLPVSRKKSLQEVIQDHWAAPLELMPWLMMVVLVALVVESLLANKFYRKQPEG